jgi:hypothetical protein
MRCLEDFMRLVMTIATIGVLSALTFACSRTEETASNAAQGERKPATEVETAATAAKCEHGVEKALCTRCDPQLAAAFKAKGDWCPEHERPESQCVLCNPELAALGVK